MKNIHITRLQILTLIIGSLFLLILPIDSFGGSKHKRINGEELTAMMDSGKPLVIVDVREKHLYDRGHILGAIHIDYYDNSQERIVKELNKEDTIVFVCHGGPMGDELSKILMKNGFTDVYNLKGGMRRWKGAVE